MARKSLDGVSVINNSQPLAISGCEDINNLLFLETLQRNKEHEANIRSQTEEKTRLYEEAHAEYRHYYERYVRHFECATTRRLLDDDSSITKDQLDQLHKDLAIINRKVKNDESVGYFTPEIVRQCQQAIRALQNYEGISEIQEEIMKMKSAVDTIQALNSSIEQKLESVTARSIDFYIEQLQREHLEKELSNQIDE